jgi:uncharacterized protein
VNPERIIEKYSMPGSLSFNILIEHGTMVARKALEIARNLKQLHPDIVFIKEAAVLHDIGIILTDEPRLGCHGDKEYICHGYLGREILEEEGFPLHALVCERHIGTGLSILEIETRGLPLPKRDMLPLSLEEKIICYADKFYSKKVASIHAEKTLDEVLAEIRRFGDESFERFETLHQLFRSRSFPGKGRGRGR